MSNDLPFGEHQAQTSSGGGIQQQQGGVAVIEERAQNFAGDWGLTKPILTFPKGALAGNVEEPFGEMFKAVTQFDPNGSPPVNMGPTFSELGSANNLTGAHVPSVFGKV